MLKSVFFLGGLLLLSRRFLSVVENEVKLVHGARHDLVIEIEKDYIYFEKQYTKSNFGIVFDFDFLFSNLDISICCTWWEKFLTSNFVFLHFPSEPCSSLTVQSTTAQIDDDEISLTQKHNKCNHDNEQKDISHFPWGHISTLLYVTWCSGLRSGPTVTAHPAQPTV